MSWLVGVQAICTSFVHTTCLQIVLCTAIVHTFWIIASVIDGLWGKAILVNRITIARLNWDCKADPSIY
jgi:hypothetical protein